MKFKIDENLPIEVAELLKQANYDAITVLEQDLGGRADPHIVSVCQREKRILITLDTDFANIRFYPPAQYPGFVVLRLKHQDKPYILKVLTQLIQLFPGERIEGHLWIVEDNRIRIRA